MSQRGHVCGNDIGDIGEITGLGPIAVNAGRDPSDIMRANSDITPLYGLEGSCRGPKMLK